jgi:arginine/lysine/ornithine decarboxylase
VLATGGLDDRRSSKRVLERAQELMADAVDAQHAFFSTCGSSLSNVGLSDHRRILAQLTFADDKDRVDRLVTALGDLTRTSLPAPKSVVLPEPRDLELEQVMLPREAFFAAQEAVPIEDAVGRIGAEQVTPYPPGIPAILPGERISADLQPTRRTRSGLR